MHSSDIIIIIIIIMPCKCLLCSLQLECLVLLVQMGCEVNMETSHLNQTPTHAAATRGHPHCVLWLTQAGADVNRQVSHAAPTYRSALCLPLEGAHLPF